MGVSSRREAEQWIAAGRIAINGEVVVNPAVQFDPERDELTVDGRKIGHKAPPRVYWLLHKPDQVLSSRRSDGGKMTLYDLPALQGLSFRVLPVGRLDYRTEGLLLLSNDGDFIHRMTHPRFKMPRHYYVLINGKLPDDALRTIRRGVELDDGPVRRCEIQYLHGKNLGASRGSWYMITVFEGRNRLVRRIFEHFDCKVVRLIRYGFGPLRLPEDLRPGEYRQLRTEELKTLNHLTQQAELDQ
jgi:23S rRNA pseudouridine2605 synthase